jgi:lipopolysaccharide exporter
MSTDVQRKMARGALWMIVLTFADRSLGLVSTLFLARALTPHDFGLVSMALSFIFIAQLISAFGFDVALIHRQGATEAHYNTAWTFNFLFGCLIMLLSLAAASPVADFYNEPSVFWILCTLAFWPFIGGLENIGVVQFRKELDFRKEFTFQISRKIIGFIVVVPLAFWWRNHWALVVGTLASRLAGTITSYIVHPFRPRFSLSQASNLLGFSKWLLVNNLLGFLKERSSDFIIGRLSGPAALGLYGITYEFSNLPSTEIGAPINRALLPGFAKLADRDELLRAYRNAMSLVAIVAIPAAAGVLAVAPYYIAVVLGKQWLGGIALMEVLAVSSGFLVFQASICSVLVARGFPDAVTRIHIAFVAILLTALFLLVPRFGVLGAAWSALAATSLTMPLYLQQMHRRVGVAPSVFGRAVVRPLSAAVVMVVAVRALLPDYSADMPFISSMLWLFAGAAVGAAVYAAIVLTLWTAVRCPAGAERHILDLIRAQVAARLRPGPAS